ncbi:MAG: hypothetical protein AVO38_10805 [delta proteobacterium ML8_D]|nr:MAG: hypothetical protein AVO38_10805 [delta proteobacterium ML8_D]
MKSSSQIKQERNIPEPLSIDQSLSAVNLPDWDPKKEKWNIYDLIDLEYFLHGDEEQDEEYLIRRDRAIFLKMIPGKGTQLPSRSSIVRRWLEVRKRQEQEPIFPGTVFKETLVLLKCIVIVLGIFSGAGLALSLLQYKGVQPVNVSGYVGLLIILQAVLLLILVGGFFLSRFCRLSGRKTFSDTFWGTLLYGLARRMAASGMNRLAEERRLRLQTTLGILKSRRTVYGNLFFFPVFMLSQLFGLAFNIGALLATLARVFTSDLAFGWQTTLQVGPEIICKLTQILALPWSWLVPEGTGFPTLVQIENSRIILKEGIAHLATPDLVSWWPFLCLGIVFYGVLPRLLICLATWLFWRITLKRLDFSHAASDSLIRRMQTPLLETISMEKKEKREELSICESLSEMSGILQPESSSGVVLMNEELAARASREDIVRIAEAYFGMSIGEILEVGGQLDQDRQVLEKLKDMNREGRQNRVLLVQEAWQPPILETLAFIRQLRRSLSEKGKIDVLLIGRPARETVFTPPRKIDRKVWEEQLQTLGDPYLGIVCARKGA